MTSSTQTRGELAEARNPQGSKTRPGACVVLLSGGLDSATTLAIARQRGFACHALSFDYGQRHRVELEAAKRVGEHLGVASHRWIRIDLRVFGHSALTDDIDVPKDRGMAQMTAEIPATYVPARNTIFLSYALALAEVLESRDIFLGVNAVDYSGYPDCRPAFLQAFQTMANLATKAGAQGHGVAIHAPLIDWPKTRIIEEGLKLGVDYGLTHSCYDPDPEGHPCRRCDSCLLRMEAFAQLGLTDPLLSRHD
ncbi:MAG: 7-cyano-7-deazaguanine synthase QueC [Phycisphaeraceae bacterium]|nr:7-cyano-7-deazaguanine synthase QueC [Phycisphaeraceae bacterium]